MAKKQMLFKTKGMNQDLSVSAFNPEFAFENMNLRLSTNESNTMMSWVNEKGTALITFQTGKWDPTDATNTADVTSIAGTVIGTAVLNHQLVLFTTGEYDYIYITKFNADKSKMLGKKLFQGNLSFSTAHPIETLVSYESEAIQKVYWTDGENQPRVINIANKDATYVNDSFNFVRKLKLEETVKVKKEYGISGMFAPGVIQYAFTYYSKYGQETAIFYTSPLLYVSHKNRGASPEEKVSCAFVITIENVDKSFDYIRMYSIQRTSINGTPFCKRVQDIKTADLQETSAGSGIYKASFTDTGSSGNSIDPTELLYKSSEIVRVGTMESKDNTLFLGNISIARNSIRSLEDDVKDYTILSNDNRSFIAEDSGNSNYEYASQLTSVGETGDRHQGMTVPCGGFKGGDYYRCGVQFQHETGKWSDPIWVDDFHVGYHMNGNQEEPETGKGKPSYNSTTHTVTLPIIKGTINNADVLSDLRGAGYKKVRPVVVFPNLLDRTVVCQGVVTPALYTTKQRDTDRSLFAQSSWFFRPRNNDAALLGTAVAIAPKSSGFLDYTSKNVEEDFPDVGITPDYIPAFNPEYLRRVEIEGDYNEENRFKIDSYAATFHSPDIEFDEQLSLYDYSNVNYQVRGEVTFLKTLSDIDIQTESPTVSNSSAGFVYDVSSFSIDNNGAKGIVSGLFYDDLAVDDNNGFEAFEAMKNVQSNAKWLIYPWQATGSLNNDINRPSGKGTASAILKKKMISNLRYATTEIDEIAAATSSSSEAQLFSSDDNTIVRVKVDNSGNPYEGIYRGNVDTAIIPDHMEGKYFAFEGIEFTQDPLTQSWDSSIVHAVTNFNSIKWNKTFNGEKGGGDYTEQGASATVRTWNGKTDSNIWDYTSGGFGNIIGDEYRDLVLKKSLVRIKYKSTPHLILSNIQLSPVHDKSLELIEILNTDNSSVRFGGTSPDALMENTWIPCGEPVSLGDSNTNSVDFFYDYGDTYFQRWDCLKTYAFTPEDINQVVEIGSFMLETRVNIDGRYDRNRGQINNLNASPQNFNLLNKVYTQVDNFFSYKIMDERSYENNVYPNQICYSKTKTSGADVDQWTSITLASILEMDGDKGSVNKLIRFNDQIICFQDRGVSQILYNERMQMSTVQGVPVELGNSAKVDGKRYLSDTIGCKNKWSIATGSNGIYFIDSNEKSIYLFNGQLTNLSTTLGLNAWCKNNITNEVWDAGSTWKGFVTHYDKKNKDILFVNNDKALAFNENLKVFTSFYNYGKAPYFCNLEDTGIWVNKQYGGTEYSLWKHQENNAYCYFFGHEYPYWTTLIANPEPQIDKIFTNLEFRANVDYEGNQGENGDFEFFEPFKQLETWNEYQHGIANLSYQRNSFIHHTLDKNAALKRRFRIWRCDIPRDNAPIDPTTENPMGIYRKSSKPHPNDRMRNPWLYLKLLRSEIASMKRTEIHDVVMTYFN